MRAMASVPVPARRVFLKVWPPHRRTKIGAEGEAAAATLDNPLIARTRAAQDGHIVHLDAASLYIASGGAGAVMQVLDEVIAAFGRADS